MKLLETIVYAVGLLALGAALGVYLGQSTCRAPAPAAAHHARVIL